MKALPSYAITFAAGLAACFALQADLLHRAQGRSVKSESNFFSSVARLQAATRDSPQILLLGSSMTGRLPDRSRGFPGVANMGCDGGSAVETLHAIDRGDLPAAPLILIEGNTLQHGFDLAADAKRNGGEEGSPVAAAVKTWSFRTGAKIPVLGAAGRPSALMYSTLMERKLGSAGGESAEPLHPNNHAYVPAMDAVLDWPASDDALLTDLSQLALRLKEKGCRLAVVILPGAQSPPGISEEFARRAQLPFWNLAAGLEKDAVQLTDGTHMAPASASSAMKTMLQEFTP